MAKPKKVTAEKFIEVWQKAESIDEVMAVTGLAANAVRQRFYSFRRKGIPLKGFQPRKVGAHTLDIPALKRLAESLAPKPLKAVSK